MYGEEKSTRNIWLYCTESKQLCTIHCTERKQVQVRYNSTVLYSSCNKRKQVHEKNYCTVVVQRWNKIQTKILHGFKLLKCSWNPYVTKTSLKWKRKKLKVRKIVPVITHTSLLHTLCNKSYITITYFLGGIKMTDEGKTKCNSEFRLVKNYFLIKKTCFRLNRNFKKLVFYLEL